MNFKQQMIESLEHSIEKAEAKAEELKKPSQKSAVHMRSAERYKEQLEELEDE